MSSHDMQFVHKPLVQVKIGGITVSLYPMPDSTMSAAERAHGFHVNKNNLLAANLTPRQVLTALGQQTNQGTVVDGEIAGYLRHFNDHWRNFQNLTISSWHNSVGNIINNTTMPADPAVLLPIQNGVLADCRQQDVRFVRAQVSVDFAYALRGAAPLRLDFYIELPQTSTAMTNGAGVAYTLITYSGPADLRTLDAAQAHATILGVTYQSAPGQLLQPTFGNPSATLNFDRFMVEVESRILRIVQEPIFKSVFLAVAPNYTDQPEVALEHVYQVVTDKDGNRTCRSVQEYYTQVLAAMQPFIQERTFPVNAAEKFKHHLDPALLPFFKQHYPLHTNVVPLDAGLQLSALRSMLSAAQAAEESRQTISNAAVTAVNAQGFMLAATPGTSAQANASQAEKTITSYKRGEPICYGCGQKHLWSERQSDGSYKVICPNKANPGVEAAAQARIADIQSKRKARAQGKRDRKKQRTAANAAFEALTDDQRKACLEAATRITAPGTGTAPNPPAAGPARKVFVVNATAYAATPTRLAMPISIQSNLPHMKLSLGPSLETANCPDILVAVDTCASIVTGYYPFLMALAKMYPHCLHKLYTSRDYEPITLSGVVQGEGAPAITTILDCTFVFHLPYKLRSDGGDTLVAIAAGKDVAVNVLLGLPFITAMGMVLDFKDNVATCNVIDHPPFPIELRRTARTVPTANVEVNAGMVSGSVVRELEHYEQWRSAQTDPVVPQREKNVRFRGEMLSTTFDTGSPAAASISMSEVQTVHQHKDQISGVM